MLKPRLSLRSSKPESSTSRVADLSRQTRTGSTFQQRPGPEPPLQLPEPPIVTTRIDAPLPLLAPVLLSPEPGPKRSKRPIPSPGSNGRGRALRSHVAASRSFLRAPPEYQICLAPSPGPASLDLGVRWEYSLTVKVYDFADAKRYDALAICMIGCAGPPTPSKYWMYHTLVAAPAFLAISTIGPSATVLQ
jgi:hypothetical protein